ncbi:LPXTG cell wall anchor domain-containing protein [Agromyces protaetiae]|uniref:Beta-xylanase n=1 Tax=Agromyces protaetiae TaxID=2509455 RepID=A0A4V0YHI0_9MICO|nr:endo-1,4-beta-xylanase [Agromyces protaetiae]QAY74781.1 LPXTG cell wall anchor domain-containing protein [Agromyces protaetiae]
MKWTPRSRTATGRLGTGVIAAALIAAPLTFVAGPVSPAAAADVQVLNSTFDDGSVGAWTGNDAATLTVVDSPDGTGKSLKVSNRKNKWDGAQIDLAPILQPDAPYTISFKARLADADQPASTVHFTVDDGSYTWVPKDTDTAIDATSWTTITGTYTLATGAKSGRMYLDTYRDGPFGDVLIDDVVITGPAKGDVPTDPTDPGTCTPKPARTVVDEDFSGETLDGTGLERDGGPTLSFEQVDGDSALRVTGRANDYDGVQTVTGKLADLVPGDTITVSSRVRLAGDTTATAAMRMVVAPQFKWLGAQPAVSASGWTTLTESWLVPADAKLTDAKVYVGSDARSDATAVYDYYVDDFSVSIQSPGCTTGGPAPGTKVIDEDFEDGLGDWKLREGGAAGGRVEASTIFAHGGTHSALVTERNSQGDGLGIDVTGALDPKATYELTAWVRFGEGQETDDVVLSLADTTAGSTSYKTLGTFTAVSNTGWTQVTASFQGTAADAALLYFETSYHGGDGTNTSDLFVDDIVVKVPEPPVIEDITPIKDTVDFPVGVAIDSRETAGAASELVLKHFDQVTPENFMKPEAWYSADHSFVTANAEADSLMTFAQENDLNVYGHVLVWHSQTPAWFFQDDSGTPLAADAAGKQALRDRMRTHIFDVAEYLSSKYGEFGSDTNPLRAFDVVNEVVDDGSAYADGLRRSEWYRILGEEYIDLAFEYANEAFNDVYAADGASHPIQLFINDYNTEQSGKQDRYFSLVERLLARGVPVDGVGHQFHVSLAMPVSALEGAIARFESLPVTQAVTELDVTTGTPESQALLIEQGYYFRDAFEAFRKHSDSLFSVTVWGLTDGRSWRKNSGAPLLFTDQLKSKPAYVGAVDGALPARLRTANVFAGDVALDADATSSPEWARLPLHAIDDESAFQARWSADHLTVFTTVTDASTDASDGVAFVVGDETYSVSRSGEVTGGGGADVADAVATERPSGYDVVVHLPLDAAVQGDAVQLDVQVTDGATTTAWNSPGVLGTLTLIEPLSYLEIAETATAPAIDGDVDAAWSGVDAVTTEKNTQGTGGAAATVRTLWKGDTLYVLAEVADPIVDVTGSDPWVQDSVELYVDPGNRKNGAYRYDDTQIRISAENAVSFGTGDEAFQRNRVQSATKLVDGGYVVEAAISLLEDGGAGTFQGLDFQVNDASNGARTSIRNWADPTGTGYQTTAHWGVGKLVAATTDPTDPGLPGTFEPITGDAPKPGDTFTVTVTGLPSETEVSLELRDAATPVARALARFAAPFSTIQPLAIAALAAPVTLGTTTTDASGTAVFQVTLPSDLAPGAYDLVVVGPEGEDLATTPLTVAAATPAAETPGGTGSDSGASPSGTAGSGGALAHTGVEPVLWLVLAALLAVGGFVLLVARRRRTA